MDGNQKNGWRLSLYPQEIIAKLGGVPLAKTIVRAKEQYAKDQHVKGVIIEEGYYGENIKTNNLKPNIAKQKYPQQKLQSGKEEISR